MKVRNGFVSNSSSSSFICDVSGREDSGWDLCLSDCDMYECVNGHIFDEKYLIKDINYNDLRKGMIEKLENEINYKYTKENRPQADESDLKRWRDNNLEEIKTINKTPDKDLLDLNGESPYEMPSGCCPICQYKHLKESDGFKFLLNKYGITKQEILQEMENQQYYSKVGK